MATNDCVNGNALECVGQKTLVSDCEDPYRCCNYLCQERSACDAGPGVTNISNGEAAKAREYWDEFNKQQDALRGSNRGKNHYISLKSDEVGEYRSDPVEDASQGLSDAAVPIFIGVGSIIFLLIIILAYCWLKNRKLQRQVEIEQTSPEGYKGARVATHASTVVLDNSQVDISQAEAKVADLEVDYTLPVKVDHQNVRGAGTSPQNNELEMKDQETLEEI